MVPVSDDFNEITKTIQMEKRDKVKERQDNQLNMYMNIQTNNTNSK